MITFFVEALFWLSVTLVAYAYAGYPLLLLFLARVRRQAVVRRPILPRVTFIIAARNEEATLPRKLDNTLGQDYPVDALQIIVASDCSTDRTDAIAAAAAPRVTLVRARERHGKEAVQKLAIAAATGDILIFSDAATTLDVNGVATIVQCFADPTVGCVSSRDRCVDAEGRLSGEGAYVKYEMLLRRLETRVNSLVGLSGSFFAARREVCDTWATDRQSDFSTLLNAVALGFRGVLDDRAVGYYCDLADTRRERQRKVRTVARGLHVMAAHLRMLDPRRYGLFAWQLASHKVCRWLVPFALIGALGSALWLSQASLFYRALLGVQAVFYAGAAWQIAYGGRLFRLPGFFVTANVAVLTAWFRFLRGDRFTTWTPSHRVTAAPAASQRL